ncbi:MAG: CDP-alcohol phosphatidyltransferase family protein [Proteobacteria bacterium]|nr:CDP-alcohol phosphatidyltransferase family protein [Pseudomonadota bacterium]
MKFLLYIPPYRCEGLSIAHIKIGGLTLYERACRSAQKAGFDEIIVASPHDITLLPDAYVTIPVNKLPYGGSVAAIKETLLEAMAGERGCVCLLDGMLSPALLATHPQEGDARVVVAGAETGIYFLEEKTFSKILSDEESLDGMGDFVQTTLAAPAGALYHRVRNLADIKEGREALTRSLHKPLGRESDGLVAYFINRPCSLQISKRIANSSITPNMVTAFGLMVGLVGACLVATGVQWIMALAVLLWQLSSMIDGIDGELARMRMTASHAGEWFDTVVDDVTNITFMLGLGHGLARMTSEPLYFHVAAVVCTLMTIAVLWFYVEFARTGIASHNHFEWGFESENKENKAEEHRSLIRKTLDLIAGGFAWVAKRDFYTFIIMTLVLLTLNKAAYFTMLTGATFIGVGSLIALGLRAIRKKLRAGKQAAQ